MVVFIILCLFGFVGCFGDEKADDKFYDGEDSWNGEFGSIYIGFV